LVTPYSSISGVALLLRPPAQFSININPFVADVEAFLSRGFFEIVIIHVRLPEVVLRFLNSLLSMSSAQYLLNWF